MADIKQCDLCRAPFVSLGSKICNECLDKMEEDLSVIREYLYEHPGKVGVAELVSATGIPRKVIHTMIETGRLEMRDNIETGVCQKCRKPVTIGPLCDDCRSKVMDDLSGVIPKSKSDASASGTGGTRSRGSGAGAKEDLDLRNLHKRDR